MNSKIALCAAVVVFTAATSTAEIIAVRFSGTGTGSLPPGTPFDSAPFEITAQYDTAEIRTVPDTRFDLPLRNAPLHDAIITIAGIGSANFEIPLDLFSTRSASTAGLGRLVEPETAIAPDLFAMQSPLFATYDPSSPIGPIFDPAPFAVEQFGDVPTALGRLDFTSMVDVTLETRVVPEPSSVAMLASGALALLWGGRRRWLKHAMMRVS